MDGKPTTPNQNFLLGNAKNMEPGNDIKINLGYHSETKTVFEGIIINHASKLKYGKLSRIELKCVAPSIKMTAVRNNFYFQNQKDSDIISKLIGNHGLQKEVDATSVTHKQIVQYHASDWDFLLMRAELNGLIVIPDNKKVSVVKPKLSGSPVLTLEYGTSIISFQGDIDARTQIDSVESIAWDMAAQKLVKSSSSEPTMNEQGNLKGKKLAAVMGGKKFQIQSTGPIDQGMLKSWANSKLLRSRLARINGSVSCLGVSNVKPNNLIELKGLGDRFNGNAYVSGVTHSYESGGWITEMHFGRSQRSFSEENQDIITEPAGGLLPAIEGLYVGKVKKIFNDPDGDTRVLVDVPVIAESGEGIWARLANLYATKNAGSFFIPEVGDEVVLGFLNNDPRFPVILGMMYNKKQTPPFTPDEKNTMKGFVTNSKMKLTFEEVKKIITIETPGKNIITISDDAKSITLEDQNKNKIEMTPDGISMTSPKDINIKATGKINIEAKQKISVKSSMDVQTEGLNVKSKAQIMNGMEGVTVEVKGSAQATVKGGIVMIN